MTSDMQMTTPYGRKSRGTTEPLNEGERGEWKSWLKTQQKKIMASGPITSCDIDGEKMESVTEFIWGQGALKSLQMVTAAMKLKDAYSLEEKLGST